MLMPAAACGKHRSQEQPVRHQTRLNFVSLDVYCDMPAVGTTLDVHIEHHIQSPVSLCIPRVHSNAASSL